MCETGGEESIVTWLIVPKKKKNENVTWRKEGIEGMVVVTSCPNEMVVGEAE
jgi:hypothetical protein